MGFEFTAREGAALYGLLARSRDDIVLKTDRDGFIGQASPGIEQLGLALPDMLIWPHLLDLFEPSSAARIGEALRGALAGRAPCDWIEACADLRDGTARWFEIQLSGLSDERGRIYGTLAVMRSREETRALEARVFAAEMTDPLTGLTNRKAFMAMLRYLVDCRAGGSLALIDIDHFRAINLRHGHAVGDDLLIAFAEFLRNTARRDDIVSRIEGETYGILLPESSVGGALHQCERIVSTLATLGHTADPRLLSVTSSAGVARIGPTLDATMQAAEMAVFFAKAKGGNCVETAEQRRAA